MKNYIMSNLQIHDNFLSPLQLNSVKEYSIRASYSYGEYDFPGSQITGMVSNIQENHDIYRLFEYKTRDLVPKGMNLYRMYINCIRTYSCKICICNMNAKIIIVIIICDMDMIMN